MWISKQNRNGTIPPQPQGDRQAGCMAAVFSRLWALALLSLTPSLSPEERVKHSSRRDRLRTNRGLDGCRGLFPLLGAADEVSAKDQNPLGQGEGERYVRNLVLLWLFILFPLLLQPAFAQPGLSDMVYTVGTTRADSGGRQWAYLLWQGTTPDLTSGRSYAVYAKTGNVAAATLYTRKAIVFVQTDPAIIQTLLNRSVNLGEFLPDLEEHINALFQKIMPTNSITLAQKVSAVIRGAVGDPVHYNNLILLSRVHPGVSLCLGFAHAELIPNTGLMTYEIREFDKTNNKDIAVIGRVTVEAGNPIVLPPPGPVVEFPDPSAKGDLNIKLRWATPPELRRLSLLNYGFNVYRMTRAFAELPGNNFHLTPPSPAVLIGLVGSQSASVRKINRPPVLKTKDYDNLSVGDFNPATGDPTNYFVLDDNGLYDGTNGVPFVNGQQFYYFVTARDILGRDGLVSNGALVTACDRMPPLAPKGLKVVNDYSFVGGTNKQVLKVSWLQNTNSPPGQTNPPPEVTTRYRVYRWNSPADMNTLSFNPSNNLIAVITHTNGQLTSSYVDDGAGAPSAATDAGRTFWYSVRAEDQGACAPGPNLSGNSAPAWGVLRDRTGPAAGDGRVNIQCVRPEVRFVRFADVPDPVSAPTNALYTLTCARLNQGIVWAEFYAFDPTRGETNFLGRRYYGPGATGVSVDYMISRLEQRTLIFLCRAGSANGKISEFASTPAGANSPKTGDKRIYFFEAETKVEQTIAGRDRQCDRHDPRPPGSGVVTGIGIDIFLTPTTKEYKLYRRVDGGPITLICQGLGDFNILAIVTCLDEAMPVNASEICYYVQLFDEHGNASPFAFLGCFGVGASGELPVPLLSPLGSAGTNLAPKMKINWFCPPHGVDHFEIWMAASPTGINNSIAPNLSSNLGPANFTIPFEGTNVTADFNRYQTPRVGPAFGVGAQFTVEVDIEQGKTYTVFIKAIGPDGDDSEPSNAEQFVWHPVTAVGPQVPWPARGLPPTNHNYHPKIEAVRLPNDIFDGIGIRIGEVDIRGRQGGFSQRKAPWITPGQTNPVIYLYTNGVTGLPVFPVAMYRYQVPSTLYPKVSGDVVQVSPLMEKIAWEAALHPEIGPVAIIRDPFIAVFNDLPTPGGPTNPINGIYLLDTQPVVLGARYRYLLVRFKDDREIDQIIPTNEVEVTP